MISYRVTEAYDQTKLGDFGECEYEECQNVDNPTRSSTSSVSPPNAKGNSLVSPGPIPSEIVPPIGRALSLFEAQQLALATVRALPVGYRFTLLSLFPDLKVRGNPRRRAGMLVPLRQQGLIKAVGLTKKGQHRRNSGFATEWEVIKNE